MGNHEQYLDDNSMSYQFWIYVKTKFIMLENKVDCFLPFQNFLLNIHPEISAFTMSGHLFVWLTFTMTHSITMLPWSIFVDSKNIWNSEQIFPVPEQCLSLL